MVFHYRRYYCLPKEFLLGHIRLFYPDFPFTSDIQVTSKSFFNFFNNSIIENKNRDVSVIWVSYHPVIIVSDYEAVEIVLSKSNLKKSSFYKYFELPNSLLTGEPSMWKVRRKQMEPFFVSKKMQYFVKLIDQEATRFVESLGDKVDEPFDMGHQVTLNSMNIIQKTVASIPCEQFAKEKEAFIESWTNIRQTFSKRLFNPFYWFDIICRLTTTGRSFLKFKDNFHQFPRDIMKIRSEILEQSPPITKPEEHDLVHLLEPFVDPIDIEKEILTATVAGYGTSAISIRWALFNLGNHLEKQEKLYREILEHFPGDTPVSDIDKINQCTYLDQFVRESLRLYPPLPVLARILDHDVIIKGKKIFKGTNALVNVWTTHRDPNVYPEPDKFDPERWSPEKSGKIPRAAYVPFGYGPRTCIGYRFGQLELKIHLIHIVRKFRLKSLKETESIPVRYEIGLQPDGPLNMIFSYRKD